MLISTLLDQFCDYSSFIKGYSDKTIRRYQGAINLYCNIGSLTHIEEVTDENVQKFFFEGRHTRKWDPSSFVTYHKSLIVFFRWCVNNEHLAENPADKIELPKTRKKLPKKLTLDEATTILQATRETGWYHEFIRSRNVAIIATFLFAGLRRQELIDLKVENLDLKGGSILVQNGKGGKDRYIPVCEELKTILQEYDAMRNGWKRTCPEFFSSFTLNRGLQVKGVLRIFDHLRLETGIKFSPHKLRHTFATLMLEGGCDIYSLSKMMGHADISTTTIYLAATPEHLRKQIAKHPLSSHQTSLNEITR